MEPADVDDCMKLGAAYPMGPLELLDFVGLDVADAIGEAHPRRHRRPRPPAAGPHQAAGRRRAAGAEVGPGVLRVRARRSPRLLLRQPVRFRRGGCPCRPWAAARAAFTSAFGSFLRPAMSQTTSASLMPCCVARSLTVAPGQLRLGQVVPAGQLHCLERAFEILTDISLDADERLERLDLAVREACAPHSANPLGRLRATSKLEGLADGSERSPPG